MRVRNIGLYVYYCLHCPYIRTIIIYVRIYLIYIILYDEAHCVPNVVFKIKNTTKCVFTGWLMRLLTTLTHILYQINSIGHYVFICCNMHANQSFTREKSLQFRRKSLNERLTNGSDFRVVVIL